MMLNRLRSDRPWLLPGILILTAIACIMALGMAAWALTNQEATVVSVPTATNVPPVEVVVVPQVVSPTLTPVVPTIPAVALATWTPVTVPVVVQVQVTVPPLSIALPANCQIRTDWQPYIVQAGDTVGALAIATNTALADIVVGNCLTNPDIIEVGATLYLPRQPQTLIIQNTENEASPIPGGTVPTAGFVLVEPSLVESGRYLIAPGRTTVRAQGVTNAVRVSFYMAAVGTNAGPVLLGVDENMADGAFILWTVDQTPILMNVWAVATSPSNIDVSTNPILVANNG